MSSPPRTTLILSQVLSFGLVFSGLVLPTRSHAQTRDRIIVVKAEQPNVWTLEQAHYLLAQMHRRNLDLKAKSLEDLDPNEIAGLRFDVMKMLIEFGATFNQADLASNRMFARNQEFNAERRKNLTARSDALRAESITLSGEIAELESKKADADEDDEKTRLETKITAKKTQLAKVDREIENTKAELSTLGVSAGELKATTGSAQFDPEKFPPSLFEEPLKEAAAANIEKFNQAPKLNASLRLDNFLQMQYEIIAKQLSLLRDELGPGERLLFLEMPQTLNVAHHESNKKWAQSWWKIAGYTKRERRGVPTAIQSPTPRVLENQKPITTAQTIESLLGGAAVPLPIHEVSQPCVVGSAYTKTNTNTIRIKEGPTSAKIHPSTFRVSATGRITKVSVKINGLTHSHADQVDILLVGPQGQNALILSDVGGPNAVDDAEITLDDGPGAAAMGAGALGDGTFQPRNLDLALDSFPKDAPVPMGGSALSVFNGTDPNGVWSLYVIDDTDPSSGSIARGWELSVQTDCAAVESEKEVAYHDVFTDLDQPLGPVELNLNSYLTTNSADLSNRQVRTVELIPRQSSLNVNDMKLKTRSGALNIALSTLFGFGSQLNVQRQREQFAQFVQQELYSSAFGKGSREFGWTFTPMPGMDRLQSGVRTTYAIVVVPDEATSIVLEANGCYFPRSAFQPGSFTDTKNSDWNVDNRTSRNCGGPRSKAFVVPIPTATIDGANDFWVKGVSYQPVGKGERIVVLISGENFSSQIGVLVNGVPLVHSIGMAQPLVRDDSTAGRLTLQDFKDSEISGQIERINANKVVFSFKMPKAFEGTPTITLVAPGKAIDINWLTNIGINGLDAPHTLSSTSRGACQKDHVPGCVPVSDAMFQGDPVRPLRIDSVEAFRRPGRKMNVLISGAGFKQNDTVFINGAELTQSGRFVSATLLRAVDIAAPSDDKIQITLNNGEKTIKSTAIVNPMQLRIDKVTVVSYEPAKDKQRGMLVVRIEGNGFSQDLLRSPRKVQLNVTSSTEAFLTIPSPNETEVVTLTDPITSLSVSTVVARKPSQ